MTAQNPPPMTQGWYEGGVALLRLTVLLMAGGLVAFIGMGVCLLLAWQRHVLWPRPKRQAVWASPHHRIEPFRVRSRGRWLCGYRAVPLAADAAPAAGLLYFNGRREHPGSIFGALGQLPRHEVRCFYYDGLGWSRHKPDEATLVADGLAVLDDWQRSSGVPWSRLSIAGRSLGAGIALPVAAARPVARLVLVSPFDRLLSAVRVRLPGVRAHWLKDRFDNRAVLARVHAPCLLVLAAGDRTVPPAVSRALFAGWSGPLQELLLPDSGHRGVMRRTEVHQAIGRFLQPDDDCLP